jgi:hypothetical protein
MALDDRQHAIEVAAGIDDRCTSRLFAPYDAAVLLEGSNRNDLDLHTVIASPR